MPVSPSTSSGSAVTPTNYVDRSYVEELFGPENIVKWADADNDRDSTKIANRVDDFIRDASAYFDDRMRGHVVELPLKTPYPATVKRIVGLIAGYRLYGIRGIDDKNVVMRSHRKEAEKLINMILSGQTELDVVNRNVYPEAL